MIGILVLRSGFSLTFKTVLLIFLVTEIAFFRFIHVSYLFLTLGGPSLAGLRGRGPPKLAISGPPPVYIPFGSPF